MLLSLLSVTGISSLMFRSRPFAPPLLYMRKDGFIIKRLLDADGD